MDEQTELQEIPMPEPLRSYYGDERRQLFAGGYGGIERRIPDPPTEQDWYREPAPN